MKERGPIVSIIVAIYNGASTIRKCIASIKEQKFTDYELIIIDGNSTDGTVDILEELSDQLDYWVSEQDSGIYNAWNKGLKVAHGDWLCFLGADDYFSTNESLGKLVECSETGDYDLITSRCAQVDRDGNCIKEFGLRWEWLRESRRHYICHPGSFHNRSLFDQFGGFDERYRISADYEFDLRSGCEQRAGFVAEVLVCIGVDGVSRKHTLKTILETVTIQARHRDIGWRRAMYNALILMSSNAVYVSLCRLGIHSSVREFMLRMGWLKR